MRKGGIDLSSFLSLLAFHIMTSSLLENTPKQGDLWASASGCKPVLWWVKII
jgi:hypothetical protein